MNETPVPDPILFDPDGDVHILVHDPCNKKKTAKFIASSKAMSFACDAWSKMLAPSGGFKESQETDGKRHISMEDNPDALALLLRIAHLKFDKVPRTLSLDTLYEVVVLTDKYFATSLVRPWIREWSDQLKQSDQLSWINQSEAANNARYVRSILTWMRLPLKWLWIAWEFGDEDLFDKLVQWLLKEKKDLEWCLQQTAIAVPPGLIESIIMIRTEAFNSILDEIYKYVDMYRAACTRVPPTQICHRSGNKKCDAMILGSLTILLLQLGLDIDRSKSTSTAGSINTIAEKVLSVEIYEYFERHSNHGNCILFQNSLKAKVLEIVNNLPSPVQESHRIHLARKKSLYS